MAARQLQRIGLQPHLMMRLQAANLTTARELFSRTVLELVEMLDLPYQTVAQVLLEVAAKITPQPTTVLALLQQAAAHLHTTLRPLDQALHGGIPSGSITELVGPAGLGKTQFCLMISVVACLEAAAQGGTVLYIDTERKFSSKRLSEIARERFPQRFPSPGALEALLQRVIVVNPLNPADLTQRLAALEPTIIDHGVRLVIIDSIAALARADLGAASVADRQAALNAQAGRLKYLAETFRIPVLVTNQVTTTMRDGQLTAALGTLWAHAVNTRLVLESYRGTRFVRIAKSPAAPAAAFAYAVTAGGLQLLEGVEAPAALLAAGSVVDRPITNEVPYEQEEAFAMAE